MKNRFITFEGIDGSGKTTQAKLLAEHLKNIGTNIILTREPGGSKGGEEIRNLLVKGEKDRWSPETEILLFTAARRDHFERVVLPGLQNGKTVISDRFHDSTKVYQGATAANLAKTIDSLHKLMIPIEPDLTFIIDMEPELALCRGLLRKSGEDRFEEFGLKFQKKLRRGFLQLAKDKNNRCVIINGNDKIKNISSKIIRVYNKRVS